MVQKFAKKLEKVYEEAKSPKFLFFTVPFDSETLNRTMQAAAPQNPGIVKIVNFRVVFAVNASATVEAPFHVPANYIGTRRSPLKVESDFYHKDLLVDVYVDGGRVNHGSMPLTSEFMVDFTDKYVKRSVIEVKITNNTSSDVEVTLHVIPNLVRENIYERLYRPLTLMGYQFLEKIVRGGLGY